MRAPEGGWFREFAASGWKPAARGPSSKRFDQPRRRRERIAPADVFEHRFLARDLRCGIAP